MRTKTKPVPAKERPYPWMLPDALQYLEKIVVLFRGRRGPLSARETRLLDALAARPASRLAELADALETHKGVLSRIVTRLERRGFVHRLPDAKDARAMNIELTAAGDRARQMPVHFDPDEVYDAL